MLLGIVLHSSSPDSTFIKYLLAFGLFGFAGGMTNWLAVKMLFDKIPFIVGSGVIPRQFKVTQAGKTVEVLTLALLLLSMSISAVCRKFASRSKTPS